MLRTEFPDLEWLKSKIASRFKEGKGWPTCILNVRTSREYRPDIAGPLSIFSNREGVSWIRVGKHRVRLEPGQYFLSNAGQDYSIEIDSAETVETMNIHVGEAKMEEAWRSLVQPHHHLLEAPGEKPWEQLHFHTQLYRQGAHVHRMLETIRRTQSGPEANPMLLDEQLFVLMTQMLGQHKDLMRRVEKLPALRAITRTEIYRRLSWARDYIHSHYEEELNLDVLAGHACMSRYHFLRLFKHAFGRTPYQYLKALRLDKARDWLRSSSDSVGEIALRLGYQNMSSFSRVFQQVEGVSPLRFREGLS